VSTKPRLLHEIIERTAARCPRRAAFRCRDELLAYGDLLTRSRQLANLLFDIGVDPGDRVGILAGKTIELPVAVFGILSAGAAYVPLDPSAPASRIESLLLDCGIRVLISEPNRLRILRQLGAGLSAIIGLEEATDLPCRCIAWKEVFARSADIPGVMADPDSLAYVIYTSGSTGAPKGIMHSHSSAMAFAEAAAVTYGLSGDDRLSNFPPLHFDQSIFDFFSGPLAGATTVLITEDVMRFPANLAELIERVRLTVWYSVPMPLTRMLLDGVLEGRDLSSVRWILYGGEVFPPKYLRELLRLFPSATISNVYGPAETNQCTFFNFSRPDQVDEGGAPIGPPWKWAKVKVVDPDHVRGPAIEQGELLVHSPTMMSGYWGGRFPEVFVDIEECGEVCRYYRTGDLVRVDDDGCLFFLGRRDRMIKSRGQRVELDEVESVLNGLDQVSEVAVFTSPGDDGSPQIHAALIPTDESVTVRSITLSLQSLLPPAAIPVHIRLVESFPRTTSGKIDRKALSGTG
jgi:amino acid adenylation domain-containing protein